ncbi:hypothetical protein CRE_26664 [Caenorhabditis remanei]|uniref:SCP domain-containing protein n=1 Tax=Caenorhabditis remanei TaxID=31234 RepID=E3MKU9_CAERE|nr:hypothetical protein CRE_26664 [Caenorhabditis remanei]
MRTLLVLLFSALYCGTAVVEKCWTEEEYLAFTRPKPGQLLRQKDLEWYNEERQLLAEKHQIANMHELKYDHGMEKDAKRIKTCEDFKHSYNFRLLDYDMGESSFEYLEFIHGLQEFKEYLHPLQTGFIYCNLTTRCHIAMPIAAEMVNLSYFKAQLFGYRGTFSKFDFQRGPPGSNCTRGKNDKGLCIAPPRSEMETFTKGPETSANKNILSLSSRITCLSAIFIIFNL